ncbi:hypothetical protein TUM17382_32920 [Shewanella algae]|nr:hypothetical protein TUM17382_32920 [Shewanella algae]
MGAMNSSQIEIKCLANGMGPYMGSQRVTGSPVRKAHPQVMGYTVAGSSASTNLGTFSWKL